MTLNLANRLTLLRVLMIPVFLIVLLGGFISETASCYIAAAIFVLASITDALDGYIARSRNMITNFGKFADPLADKLLVCSALISLIGLSRLSAWVVIVIISREFVITGFRTLAAEKGIILAASFSAKLKTASQMVMITALLINIQNDVYSFFCTALVVINVVLAVYSAVEYIYVNRNVLKG